MREYRSNMYSTDELKNCPKQKVGKKNIPLLLILVSSILLFLTSTVNAYNDDTAMIQNIINTENPAVLPAGTYYITSPLSLPEGKIFKGSGKKLTTIVADASMDYMAIVSSNTKIEGIYFDGNVSAIWGILVPGVNAACLDRVRVRYCNDAGIVLGSTQNSYFVDTESYGNDKNWVLYNHCANNTFLACDSSNNYTKVAPHGTTMVFPQNDYSCQILMATTTNPLVPGPATQKNRNNRFIGGIYEHGNSNLHQLDIQYSEDGNIFIGVELTGNPVASEPEQSVIYVGMGKVNFRACKINHAGGKTAIVEGGYLEMDDACLGGGMEGMPFPNIDVREGGSANAIESWNSKALKSNTKNFMGGTGNWYAKNGAILEWSDSYKRLVCTTTTSYAKGLIAVSSLHLGKNIDTDTWVEVTFLIDNILPETTPMHAVMWYNNSWTKIGDSFSGPGMHKILLKIPAGVGNIGIRPESACSFEMVHFDLKAYGMRLH